MHFFRLKSSIGLCLALGTAASVANIAIADSASAETIAMVRHGEKPDAGLGQLDCQGLNRALALPAVIKAMFGIPKAIFAPDPSEQKKDNGQPYDYVRPLATIEPAAIAFGLPVDASIGVSKLRALRKKLESASDQDAFLLVAWEHHDIVTLARRLMSDFGGDPDRVPVWKDDDFDSIYVIKFKRTGQGDSVDFDQRHEGLDGQKTACPD